MGFLLSKADYSAELLPAPHLFDRGRREQTNPNPLIIEGKFGF